MPAILRRRKLISIKPERKNAVTYHKEEVQAEVMTPPPAADQQKIPGSTVVCPACKREVNKAEVEKNANEKIMMLQYRIKRYQAMGNGAMCQTLNGKLQKLLTKQPAM